MTFRELQNKVREEIELVRKDREIEQRLVEEMSRKARPSVLPACTLTIRSEN